MLPTAGECLRLCSSTVFKEDREITYIGTFKNIFSGSITAGSGKKESVPHICII